MKEFLNKCRSAIGENYVLTEPVDTEPYLTDWRRRFTGKALTVLKPASTEEIATIVSLCEQFNVPIVPQGGNTGLVLGSIPDQKGNAIVLSLRRLNRIRTLDTLNNTITVEAGCILEQVQNTAENAGKLFPLSLAAEGSCTIGGNLSTNAGGTNVLRYGTTRELCLGLEVVTAQGEIWSSLRGLRKDNTGYDLRNLFIGAEGTLGIITAAVLKLFPQPQAKLTALAAMHTPANALALLSLAQQKCGATLTAFELMSDFCMQLVTTRFLQLHRPFPQPYPQYILLEISDNESEKHAAFLLETVITEALEQGIIQDAIVASSFAQSQSLWSLREHIPLAQAEGEKNIKHDVSIPISRIADFIETTNAQLTHSFPGCRMVIFGHLGDGNLHYNVTPQKNGSEEAFISHQEAINRIVHNNVHYLGGSISAEHGLGALKRNEIRLYKSAVEMKMMHAIKSSLDPRGLMNPGKIL